MSGYDSNPDSNPDESEDMDPEEENDGCGYQLSCNQS